MFWVHVWQEITKDHQRSPEITRDHQDSQKTHDYTELNINSVENGDHGDLWVIPDHPPQSHTEKGFTASGDHGDLFVLAQGDSDNHPDAGIARFTGGYFRGDVSAGLFDEQPVDDGDHPERWLCGGRCDRNA